MLLVALGISDPEISHVLSIALDTELQVGVAVKLTQKGAMDAAFPMETIDILTNDLSNMAFINQLNHCHVALRWPCSSNCVVKVGPLPERQLLAFLGA